MVLPAIHTIKTIDISSIDTGPSGLTFDGKNLWMCGQQNNKIYQIDRLGNLIKTITPGGQIVPAGLAFDGKNLWYGDSSGQTINQIDRNGKQISSFNPAETPTGLTFDGKNLWITFKTTFPPYISLRIYDRLGNLIKTITISGEDTNPSGITTTGKNMFWTGTANWSIYQIDKLGKLIHTYNVGGTDVAPNGITFDGVYLWWVGNSNNILVQTAFS